ncbi:MAG: rhomboid family intramembrane serine protease [Lachnospiraceae bacterium]|nr:rhomboid family intramembrane serine protease [Lachnospiraceae bacterium]
MLASAIGNNLENRGYTKAAGNVTIADFYVKINDNREMTICSVIKNMDGVDVTADQVVVTAQRLERKFLIEGYRNVEIMHIMLTDHEVDVRQMEDQNIKFWIVDMNKARLMIYENQPQEFEELHILIEKWLNIDDLSNRRIDFSKAASKATTSIAFVTIALIVINVIMFLFCELAGGSENTNLMLNMGALNYWYVVEQGQYYRLFTSMFLHFGIEHIFNNMFSLAIVGNVLEKSIGKLNFVLIYFASGFGGSVASIIYHMSQHDNAICAGASGAIYGLFGAVIACAIMDKSIDLRRIFICLMILLFTSTGESVDWAAHIGGMLVGFIMTLVLVNGKNLRLELE